MKEALGLVETRGISTAIEVADVMVKAANVTILELENSRGSGYMTIKVTGDVGAVKASVDAAKSAANKFGNLVSASVIARPADGMAALFCNPDVPYKSVNKKAVPYAWYDEEEKTEPVQIKQEADEPEEITEQESLTEEAQDNVIEISQDISGDAGDVTEVTDDIIEEPNDEKPSEPEEELKAAEDVTQKKTKSKTATRKKRKSSKAKANEDDGKGTE